MIYYLYCGLIMSGYSACSALLGSYMMYYTGATEIDLGLIFMVQPLTVFLRPLVCARADRYQSHQQMLSVSCLFTALAYFPFIIYPFFHSKLQSETNNYEIQSVGVGTSVNTSQQGREHFETNEILADLSISPMGRMLSLNDSNTNQQQPIDKIDQMWRAQDYKEESLRYWILIMFHLVGSIGWCGVRSLGDALACNYAKRIGTDFARYRKYGAISYGLCNVSLGFINQDWIVPNFVPSLTVYCVSMILLSILVYVWPSEYFQMSSKNYNDPRVRQAYISSLPSNGATMRHLGNRLLFRRSASKIVAPSPGTGELQQQQQQQQVLSTCEGEISEKILKVECNGVNSGDECGHFGQNLSATKVCLNNNVKSACTSAITGNLSKQNQLPQTTSTNHDVASKLSIDQVVKQQQQQLTVKQQMQILALLLRRDFRILLYLLVIFYGGLVGYSGPNFVFTYINVVCQERQTCNGSQLCGIAISAHCFVETIVYMLVDKFRNARANRILMLEITFFSLTIHYYFYGFAIEHLSPYFFLIECLHGIEYGISLTTSVELGYYFAREVELLLPELEHKAVISERDNKELVKKSLMATLSSCYTMAYEGVGTIVGCLLMGMVTGHYSFIVTWIMIGTLSAVGFLVILFGYLIGKCFQIRPEILRIRDRQMATATTTTTLESAY